MIENVLLILKVYGRVGIAELSPISGDNSVDGMGDVRRRAVRY